MEENRACETGKCDATSDSLVVHVGIVAIVVVLVVVIRGPVGIEPLHRLQIRLDESLPLI